MGRIDVTRERIFEEFHLETIRVSRFGQKLLGLFPIDFPILYGDIKPGAVQERLIEESSILELGQVIENPDIGRTSEDQITVVDLTGVAIQDIQIAKMVARAVREDKKQTRQES